MTRYDMLNEHLQEIYIIEDVNTAINKLKSKSKNIIAATKNGNILRIKKEFDNLPNISPKEAKVVALKKMKKEYKESEKIVNSKIKKGPEDIKTTIIALRASLVNAKENIQDPKAKEEITKKLEKLDAQLARAGEMLVSGGVHLAFITFFISIFVGGPLISMMYTLGFSAFVIGIILYMVAFLIRVFVEAKKAGDKVIQ